MTKKLHRISVAQFCRKSLQNKYSYIFLAVLCCLGTFSLLAASKAKIQKSVVAKESLFQQILLTCRNMEKKVMAKADYSPEMKSLRAYHPAVERQKFQTVAAMVQKKEKLQAQGASSEILERLEKQRKQIVERYNEFFRLQDQMERNVNTPVFSEKLQSMIVFLDPGNSLPKQGTPLARRSSKEIKQKK